MHGSPTKVDSAVLESGLTNLGARQLHWAHEGALRHLEPAPVFEAGLRQHHLSNTAYPIAHRKTIWSFRAEEAQHAALLRAALAAADRISLYLHVPFCETRCRFCEYTVVKQHSVEAEAAYADALLRELRLAIEQLALHGKPLSGLDIGGGTPALIDPAYIARLVEEVARRFSLAADFGMSIETTPKIAATSPERMCALRALGIDRISMGLQTANRRLLKKYGRDLNDVTYNRRAVDNIRGAGFERLNIDLMYGFAGQSLEAFVESLEHTLALDPEYVTLYRMRYKGTSVREEASEVVLADAVAMYDAAFDLLNARGYAANPGKNGFSRVSGDPGTSAYLTERVVNAVPYLGLGLGAQTFTNNILAYNLGAASKKLDAYLDAVTAGRLPIQDLYLLPRSEAMAKMVSVSFYFGEINLGAFEQRFGAPLERCFGREVEFVLERGLMTYHSQRLRLTRAGARAFNGVVALFYSDRVKQHLVEM